jgi:hypothetical protein
MAGAVKVRLSRSVQSWASGEEVEVSEATARRYVQQGDAVYADASDAPPPAEDVVPREEWPVTPETIRSDEIKAAAEAEGNGDAGEPGEDAPQSDTGESGESKVTKPVTTKDIGEAKPARTRRGAR